MRPPTPEELVVARRVWRLALLITADQEHARRAVTLVPPPPPAQPLDAQRLDRLAIQAIRRVAGPARRMPPGLPPARAGPDSPAPLPRTTPPPHAGSAPSAPRDQSSPPTDRRLSLGPAHDVVAAMPLQAAEVWVLRRVDDLDPVRTCRAMDCSRTAADRFLARAESDLAAALGDASPGHIADLRARADSLVPDDSVVQVCTDRARQRARRQVMTLVLGVAAVLALVFIAASAATLA